MTEKYGAEQDFPIDRLSTSNIRETTEEQDLPGLVQTIKEHGVMQAVLVRRDGDKFVIVEGHRRFRASVLAGRKTIPVKIFDRELSPAEVLILQLVANCQRKKLTPIEEAKAIDRLMKQTGWSAVETGAKLGKSPPQVCKLTLLLILPLDIQEKISQGKLSASTAYEIAKVSDPVLRSKIAAEAVEKKLSRGQVIARIKKAAVDDSKGRSRAPRKSSRIEFSLGEGRKLVVFGQGLTVEALLTWFQSVGQLLKNAPPGISLSDLPKLLANPG